VGNYNIAVEVYHTVPGEAGNVRAGAVALCEGFNDLVKVTNLLPATGGRNAESIEEIIRRAPSVLTSRDRAVTRLDFEVIAKEASGEVARAACDGRMASDGEVEVVILPQRRPGELIPDPFLSTGLKEHVQRYLAKRCLVNVTPKVRLATFQKVDVAVTVRLRPHANFILVRELAKGWVKTFLDPYEGGLDGQGWPFGGRCTRRTSGAWCRIWPRCATWSMYTSTMLRTTPNPLRAGKRARGCGPWCSTRGTCSSFGTFG
jgi:predicted phage baseplate assembly protein